MSAKPYYVPIAAAAMAGLVAVPHYHPACLPSQWCEVQKAALPDEPAHRTPYEPGPAGPAGAIASAAFTGYTGYTGYGKPGALSITLS